MIADALLDTGLAGVPFEYMHPDAMPMVVRRLQQPQASVDQYLQLIEARRTTSNGVFGAKVHAAQLLYLKKDLAEQLSFLKRFDRVIFISRRNKVAQAVSWHRSKLTGVWRADSQEDLQAARVREDQYHRLSIAGLLASVIWEEEFWIGLIRRAGIPAYRFVYEDIAHNYTSIMENVARFLNIRPSRDWAEKPKILKIADKTSQLWESRFLADIRGQHDGSAASN